MDDINKTFNRLTVKGLAERKGGQKMYLCECSCGTIKEIRARNVKDGTTKSCGCIQREQLAERNKKHGHGKRGLLSPEYKTWKAMVDRCENENSDHYIHYGARGIKICPEWRNDFERFLEDMGSKPSPNHSIDRMDVNGNYEPSNCVWATPEIQSRNQRIKKTNKTGVRGVSFQRKTGKYQVHISVEGKSIYLGSYSDLEEAAKAREKGELKYWVLVVNPAY